jgi:hypothetical protein
MLAFAMPLSRVVAIAPEAPFSEGHGERSRVSARIAMCTGLEVEREPDKNDAGRREPRQLPTPILPFLPSDHPIGQS